jgi:hypothetical protein
VLLPTLGAAACSAERTEVVVVVSAHDLTVPVDLDSLRLTVSDRTVTGAAATRFDDTVPLCPPGGHAGCYDLPLLLTLVPGDQRPNDPVTVDLEARLGTGTVVRDEATFTFRTGASMRLDFILYRACVDSDCAASGTSCNAAGMCGGIAPEPFGGDVLQDAGLAADQSAATDDAAPMSSDLRAPTVDSSSSTDGPRPDFSLGPDLLPVERSCGSLSLDGTNGAMLTVPNPQVFFTNVTAEAWIYITANPSANVQIIGKGNNADGSTKAFSLWLGSDGKPFFQVIAIGALYQATASQAVPVGQWTHVAGQWKDSPGATNAVFVDGNPNLGTAVLKTPDPNSDGITIGNTAPGTAARPFSGLIDEVRVSSNLRYSTTAAFVPQKQFTSDGWTELLLHLDEASGTLALDSSPEHQNGMLGGNAQFSPSCVPP